MHMKGDIRFSVDGQEFQFNCRDISRYGIIGLTWHRLSPEKHLGKGVDLCVTVHSVQSTNVNLKAYIVREQTAQSMHINLKFARDQQTQQAIDSLFERQEPKPPPANRKYPRITFSRTLMTFPAHVLVSFGLQSGSRNGAHSVFDVGNLSPNGVLLTSENQMLPRMGPGTYLQLTFEPRGPFHHYIHARGMVRRQLDDIDMENENLLRCLGVEIVGMDELNQDYFRELIKSILLQIKGSD